MVSAFLGHVGTGPALAVAAAVICWPARPARHRLAAVLPAAPDGSGSAAGWLRRRLPGGPRSEVAVVAAAAVGVGALVGVGGGIAAAMALGLGLHRWRAARRERRREKDVAALVDVVGLMAAELRAGAHPVEAAASASAGEHAVHRVFTSVVAGARLGAPVPALLARHAAGEAAIADELSRLASAWALAERHGIALAELVDAVRADLDARVRLAGEVRAQLAGPRATAVVLAGLPLLGVALGEGVGADPWRVLSATTVGQVLLVIGTGLACAGMPWSGRITAAAVPR